MNATPCIDLANVSKWVGEGAGRTEILRDVSFQAFPGEFVAIMGTSGSGKSTLLNLIGLLDQPSRGAVSIAGKPVQGLADDQLALLRARSIGFIFQSFNLIPYLNAQENVELGRFYSRQEKGISAKELLTQVRLAARLKAYPATLSGGERQRVAIARALINRPRILLADEPTGALDSSSGMEIMNLLKDLHRSGTAIVLITHDEAIARHAQRILRMRDGRLV